MPVRFLLVRMMVWHEELFQTACVNLQKLFKHAHTNSVDVTCPVLVGEELNVVETNEDLELEMLHQSLLHEECGGLEQAQDQYWEG